MKLSDWYLITNTSPGLEIVPYSDFSLLWFKWLFVIMIKFASTSLLFIILVLGLFALPFAGKIFLQQAILEEDFKDGVDCDGAVGYSRPGVNHFYTKDRFGVPVTHSFCVYIEALELHFKKTEFSSLTCPSDRWR